MKHFVLALTLAAAACAQPALAPPQVGFLVDGANSVRPILGIAGNFLLGGVAFPGVLSAAHSGAYGLLKTDHSVIAIDSQGQALSALDAPPGPAFFAFFQDGSPAFAYVPSANLLFQWYGSSFQMIRFDCQIFPAAAVVGISAPDSAHVAFLIQRQDSAWEVRFLVESGESDSQTALPGVNAPALRLASGELVYSDSNGIDVRRPDGSEIHLNAQLPPSFSLAPIGAGWIAVSDLASPARLAVRLTAGHEGLFSLPEVNQ